MAANVLPILFAGVAAAVLLGKKKKKRKRAPEMEYVPADIPPPPKLPAKAPSGASAPSEIWKQRQTALAYLGGLGVCDCNPGLPDGIYGKDTRDAILGFQAYANIGRTGKWDQPTDTMMKRALEMAAQGLIKIPKAAKKAPPSDDSKISWAADHVLGFLPRNVWRVNTEGVVTSLRKTEEARRYYPKVGDRYAEVVIWKAGDDSWDDVLTALRTISIDRPEVMFSFFIASVEDKKDFGHARFDLMEQFSDRRTRVRYHHLNFRPEEMMKRLPDGISAHILGYVTWLTGERKSL